MFSRSNLIALSIAGATSDPRFWDKTSLYLLSFLGLLLTLGWGILLVLLEVSSILVALSRLSSVELPVLSFIAISISGFLDLNALAKYVFTWAEGLPPSGSKEKPCKALVFLAGYLPWPDPSNTPNNCSWTTSLAAFIWLSEFISKDLLINGQFFSVIAWAIENWPSPLFFISDIKPCCKTSLSTSM